MVPTTQDPRRLHLLRHAKSSRDDPSVRDHARPLAPRGEAACVAMARYWSGALGPVDLVLCSTAERTRQTWAGVQPAVPGEPAVVFTDEIYEADADTLLALLRSIGPREDVRAVLLVGHNPAVADLAMGLSADRDSRAVERMAQKYPSGALATYGFDGDWSTLGYGGATLQDFVRPRDLPPV